MSMEKFFEKCCQLADRYVAVLEGRLKVSEGHLDRIFEQAGESQAPTKGPVEDKVAGDTSGEALVTELAAAQKGNGLDPYKIPEKKRYTAAESAAMKAELDRLGIPNNAQTSGPVMHEILVNHKAIKVGADQEPEPPKEENTGSIPKDQLEEAVIAYVKENGLPLAKDLISDITGIDKKTPHIVRSIPEDKYEDIITACDKGYTVEKDGSITLGK